MKKILFLALMFLSVSIFGQGTKRFKLKKYRVSILNDKIRETSGLQVFNGKMYTFNDGGNAPKIFEINPRTGDVLDIIKMPFNNKDWEAMTADENHLYIADFGNNKGNRKDLKIYKIPFRKEDFDVKDIEIPFYYPEQKDFSKQSHKHNFDAESIIYLDGKLHIFTKEWKSKKTTHYTIDVDRKDNQPAKKLEKFDLGYLATDASYYNGKVYIVGYTKKARVFLTIFEKDKNGLFFTKNVQKYILGSAGKLGQVEGIEVNEKGIYISAEKMKYKMWKEPPSYYFVPWKALK